MVSAEGPEVHRMNSDIPAGAGDVHPVILKELRYEIACPDTMECNLLLLPEWYPRNGRCQMQHQFLRGLRRPAGERQTGKFHFHIGKKKANYRKANR